MGKEVLRQIREHEIYRNSFMELAEEVFGLSFRAWYENGFWTDRYIPYAMVDGERVIANASANIIDTDWRGKRKRYIQIGTVMTHPDRRKQGLMRITLETLLEDWKESCDGIYLYANDNVKDFYPGFGFEPAQEYGYRIVLPDGKRASGRQTDMWERLNMSDGRARRLLKSYYGRLNPYCALPMLDNYGLLMFYCADFMKECVYYSRQLDAVCVAAQEGNTVKLWEVFGNPGCSLKELAGKLPFDNYDEVVLGFTPVEAEGCICERLAEEDTTLFVYRDKENIFREGYVRMPELSRA